MHIIILILVLWAFYAVLGPKLLAQIIVGVCFFVFCIFVIGGAYEYNKQRQATEVKTVCGNRYDRYADDPAVRTAALAKPDTCPK